jgi:hypothetical protein
MVQRPRQSLAVQTQDLSPHFGIALGNPRKIAETATREFTDAIGRIVKCIRIREGYEMREMAHPCDILVVISSGASLDSSAERAPKRLNPLNGRVPLTEVIRLNPIGIRDWSDDTGCAFKKVSTRMIRTAQMATRHRMGTYKYHAFRQQPWQSIDDCALHTPNIRDQASRREGRPDLREHPFHRTDRRA